MSISIYVLELADLVHFQKFVSMENLALGKKHLLFPLMVYKNSSFENTLFENSDRKAKMKIRTNIIVQTDKRNHLFYPLGILLENSTAIYFSREWILILHN